MLIPILAVVLTSLTGLVRVHGGYVQGQYGFPLVWKTQVECYYSPIGFYDAITAYPCGYTKYWWEFFALNTALYMGLGYSIVSFVKKRWSLFATMIIPALAGWLTSATVYWGNGFPIRYAAASPPGFVWIDFIWVLFGH